MRTCAVTYLDLAGLAAALVVAGCGFRPAGGASATGGAMSGGAGGLGGTGTGGATTDAGRGGAAGSAPMQCNPCSDFPPDPILDMPPGGTPPPPDVGTTFGPAGTGSSSGGPCLLDPEPDSLFPRNWLRPRFEIQPGAGEDVFEIRVHADIETNDLVVYTKSTVWTMPATFWTALSTNVIDQPITVSVRGLVSSAGAVALGPSETISIAPVTAPGTIVYWTTTGGSALKGFSIGDESVVTVITPAVTPGKCVGCHSSTPGGQFIGLSNSSSATNGDPSHIEIRSGTMPANQPSFLTATAHTLLGSRATAAARPVASAGQDLLPVVRP